MLLFPIGNIGVNMSYTATTLGQLIRETRTARGLTQQQLALDSGTGLRFIGELERGKATCQLGKALAVLAALKMHITVNTCG